MLAVGRSNEATADWLDRIAVLASVTCMVHCLLLPLVIAALPALSAFLSVPESFHRWVLTLAVPAASIALVHGRRCHGQGRPLLLGAIGIAALAIAALLLPEGRMETATTVAGSVLVGWAHLANWRLRRRCWQ